MKASKGRVIVEEIKKEVESKSALIYSQTQINYKVGTVIDGNYKPGTIIYYLPQNTIEINGYLIMNEENILAFEEN